MAIRIHFFRNLAICFSTGHQSNLHAHQALQMTVGLDSDFSLELGSDHESLSVRSTRFACIPPQTMHKILAIDSTLAYLYIDTNPVIFARWRHGGGVVKPPSEELLIELRCLFAQEKADRETVQALTHRWCEHSLPGLLAIKPTDPRISRSHDIIDTDLHGALNYAELASAVHLSPSRFASLFREQTGLPVRNFVLWRRLVYVFERLERGDSITTAAHNAGFSDCAHLSRSFHQILGAKPSEISVVRP